MDHEPPGDDIHAEQPEVGRSEAALDSVRDAPISSAGMPEPRVELKQSCPRCGHDVGDHPRQCAHCSCTYWMDDQYQPTEYRHEADGETVLIPGPPEACSDCGPRPVTEADWLW
jgi:hypothetical protein